MRVVTEADDQPTMHLKTDLCLTQQCAVIEQNKTLSLNGQMVSEISPLGQEQVCGENLIGRKAKS